MARLKERELAITLRKKGRSYSQIKKLINVSKGTLSGWLADYPLSQEQLNRLDTNREERIEKFRDTWKKKNSQKLAEKYRIAQKTIGKLSEREKYLAGLFLYWGEGTKNPKGGLSLTNTNPKMIKFFLSWLYQINIPIKRIRILLQIYRDMNPEVEIKYWQHELGIPVSCFRTPYIKKSNIENFQYKGRFGHGTCTATYHNTELAKDVAMALKYLMENFQK